MRYAGTVRLLAAPLIALSILVVPAAPATAVPTSTGNVDVIAHRGSSGIAPENTAAAVDAAIGQRADFVEIDVQRTRDGHLVNFHDCTMERTTDVEERFPGRASYRVSDFTWEQVRSLDAGSWFDESFAGERIISVREVVQQVRGRAGLLAEISPCGHYDGLPQDLAVQLRAIPGYLEHAASRGRLAVQSFDVNDAKDFHELLSDVPIGVLDAERPSDAELIALGEWADQVNPQWTVTDRSLTDRVHELGMSVNVWTVNEPGAMHTMVDMGVDGIITDYPQTLTGR